MLISAQRQDRPSGYKIQRQDLKSGGNEAMTKQRIGVLVVCLLLAAAGVAQTPPAKQMAVEKKSGGTTRSLLVMPGSEQWMDIPAAALVGPPVGRDGRNGKDCGPTGRSDDGWPFVHASAFLHGRDKDCAALASDDGKSSHKRF
jgi:hypothetical protein